MVRGDLDEFVECYHPENRHQRKPTWDEKKPPTGDGVCSLRRDRCRDKCSLDIFWLKDESLEDSSNYPTRTCWPLRSPKTFAVPWSRSRASSGISNSVRAPSIGNPDAVDARRTQGPISAPSRGTIAGH